MMPNGALSLTSTYSSQSATGEVREDLACRVVARRAGHPSARVRARSTHVQPVQRPAIVAMAEHRARGEHLVEAQRAVKDVSAHEPERSLEIERAVDLTPQHRRL